MLSITRQQIASANREPVASAVCELVASAARGPVVSALRRSPRGHHVALHAHPAAQLIFPTGGTLEVCTAGGRWVAPRGLAVWIPGAVAHRTDMLSDVESRVLKIAPAALRAAAPADASDGPLGRAFAFRLLPLLAELVLDLATAPPERAALSLRLLLHVVAEAPSAPTFLPMPVGPVARRVAEAALADRGARLDVAALADRAATSARTLSRLFPAETGLSFKAWRQRARIVGAMDALAAGQPVSRVAGDSGFSTPAAFSFAFRQVTGQTPTAFLARRGDGAGG